jgi:hypothetical protein
MDSVIDLWHIVNTIKHHTSRPFGLLVFYAVNFQYNDHV